MTKKQYPTAKMDKFLHAAPQFRPIKRGARRKGIEREYYSNDCTKKLTIRLFYELDVADQDLLLCLIAMSSANHKSTIISPEPTKSLFIGLREKLELEGESVTAMDAIASHATAYEILKELGKRHGKSGYKWLEASLNRLSAVSFTYKTQTEINAFHLLSWSSSLDESGSLKKINFSVNPYSAVAILGGSSGYTLVHREERAALYSEEARALHGVLSGLVDMGRERVFLVDMLSDKVYSRYDEAISTSASIKRRRRLLKASVEIDNLDYWDCESFGIGKLLSVKFKRKKRK